MMTNYERYEREINSNKEYSISVKDFLIFLQETDSKEAFEKELIGVKRHALNMYDVAVDWSIPVIMVKALR